MEDENELNAFNKEDIQNAKKHKSSIKKSEDKLDKSNNDIKSESDSGSQSDSDSEGEEKKKKSYL